MGGTKKLSKFIVDWENGTRHGCMRLETGLTIRILRYLSNIYEDIPN